MSRYYLPSNCKWCGQEYDGNKGISVGVSGIHYRVCGRKCASEIEDREREKKDREREKRERERESSSSSSSSSKGGTWGCIILIILVVIWVLSNN